jgi:hypothetical protein
MHPDGISDAILQSGDIKKTAFPASTPKRPNVRLVYIKIENKVFIYEFSALPDPASRISSGFMEDGKVRVIFHEDKKIYIIPNKANWEDAMQKYKQPVGWPVFPTAEPN